MTCEVCDTRFKKADLKPNDNPNYCPGCNAVSARMWETVCALQAAREAHP